MSDIRLRYAGLVSFFVRIMSLFTGLVFITIITRNLSTAEYGQWSAISSLLTFGIFPIFLLGFWYTRYTARGISVARTGILLSVIFSLGGTIIFFVAGKLFIAGFDELIPILLIAVIQVPTSALITSLMAISNGKRPEFSSYGFLVFEVAKVLIALAMVFLVKISLINAIIILVIAEAIHAITLAILIRDELKKRVKIENIKKILKSLWIPFYSRVGELVYTADVFVVSSITSSFSEIGLFKVGFVFANIVGYVSNLSYPLYIKLLGGGKESDLRISANLTFTFAIPLAIGTIILSKPLLFLLNPMYVSAEGVLQILVFYNFVMIIDGIYDNLLLGIEKADMGFDFKLKDQIKSSLFRIPTLNTIRVSSYLVGLVILTLFYFGNNLMESFGEMWAIILLSTSIPVTLYKFRLAKAKKLAIFPWKSILKYTISSAVMGVTILYFVRYLSYNPKTILFAPQIGSIILLAIASYSAILLLIDSETRQLAKNVISVLRK